MTRIFVAISTLLSSSICANAQMSMESRLPFEITLGDISEEQMFQASFTVGRVTIVNGPYFLRKVSIHCEARNSRGTTSDVTGETTNVDVGEMRPMKLISTSGDETGDFTKASELRCALKGFELGFM